MPTKKAAAKKAPAKKAPAKKAAKTPMRKVAAPPPPSKPAAGPKPTTRPAAEIRVHGVGGSSPGSILGLGSDTEADVVTFGDRTVVCRRPRDLDDEYAPEIEGYVWSGLTSGSSLQPFWLLLLPFTLVNVAGWMHEPVASFGRRAVSRIQWIRRLTFLFGLSMTATYIVWATAMLEDSVGTRWLPVKHEEIPYPWFRLEGGFDGYIGHWRSTPRWGAVLGGIAMLLILTLLGFLARSARRAEREPEPFLPAQEVTRGGVAGVGARKDESLRDYGFFNRAKDSGRLLGLHLGFSVVLIIAITGFAFAEGTGDSVPPKIEKCQRTVCWQMDHPDDPLPEDDEVEPPEYLKWSFYVVGGAQAGLLLVLLPLSFVGRKRRRGFRFSGSAVACGLAVMIANATFAGASRALDNRLGVDAPLRFLFADFVVLTLAIMVIAALVWAFGHHVLRVDLSSVGPKSDEPVPENTAPSGAMPNGATSSARKLTARFRALATSVTKLDAVLTVSVVLFGVLALVVGGIRIDDPDFLRSKLLAVAGAQVVTWTGVALVAVMWIKRKDRKTRKLVGIIWDLLTFWPRRFHPFAVRPYSEQAVPELRGAIRRLRQDHDHVLISCHSQGTILSFAAIAPTVVPEEVKQPLTIVTYGSPLGGLFRVFFPAYFTPEVMSEVHEKVHVWRNFRRRTDPISSEIGEIETEWLESPGVTPDPEEGGLWVEATRAERDRDPWVSVETHSNYRSEPAMKRAIDKLRYPS
jgi:hypothetical protein